MKMLLLRLSNYLLQIINLFFKQSLQSKDSHLLMVLQLLTFLKFSTSESKHTCIKLHIYIFVTIYDLYSMHIIQLAQTSYHRNILMKLHLQFTSISKIFKGTYL